MSDNTNVWIPTYGVGHASTIDERFKRRKRKGPLGFTKLETRPKAPPKKRK